MKKRRPIRRKQSRKRTPPTSTPSLDWHSPLAEPTPIRAAATALGMSGIVQPPLPLREAAAAIQAEDATLRADATVGRAAQHKEMLSRTEVLDWLIANLPEQPKGGPGHNLQPITQDDVEEIKRANATIKALPVTPEPSDKDKASAAVSTLKKIGERLGKYLDDCLSEASKELGKKLVSPSWWALWYTLTHIVQSVTAWLH